MSGNDTDDGEPFLTRWSRRKQATRDGRDVAASPHLPSRTALQPPPVANQVAALDTRASPPSDDDPSQQSTSPAAPRALTEADFADVDFAALDYSSDYNRFMQAGVPESIRQQALSKLWLSDPIFTQVDPFQDYAGDYTDAAVVPLGGVKTAYKIGRGFLSQEEAHAWDRLGKPALAAEIAALAPLVPGYRVRAATAADGTALLEVQLAAIRGPGAADYGSAIAESWAHGLTVAGYEQSLDAGEHFEVAIHDETGSVVGFLGTLGDEIKGLHVRPGHGRMGLATALLARAAAALRDRGALRARLDATLTGKPLYQRCGYRVVREFMKATRGGLDQQVFEMTKLLVAADDIEIDAESPDQPEIAAFFAQSEAYMAALYPAASNHFAPLATLLMPEVLFLVARGRGLALGCGAIVPAGDGTAEIKRMWVEPEARGLKIGAKVLAALEFAAGDDGITALRLETGIAQPEALGLYRAAGYADIAAFGDYRPDPLSVFMEKWLKPHGAPVSPT